MANRASIESGEVVVAQPDWWSRLMSLGAILLAGAALLNSMGIAPSFLPNKLVGQTNPPGEQQTNSAGDVASTTHLADATPDVVLPRDAMTDEAASDPAVTQQESDVAEPAHTQDETASAADSAEDPDMPVQDLFDEPSTDEATMADSTVADTNAPSEAYGTESADDDALIDLQGLDKHPELQIVQTVLKPTGERPTVTVTVKNTGTASAKITSAIFMPTQVVELPREVSLGKLATSDDSNLVIAFNADDNLATEEGKHADYARSLQGNFAVAPGETVRVHIAIQDSEFVGYGFEGDLRLVFDDFDKLEVSGVTIAFVQ